MAERDGDIVAYATSVTFWPMGHGVGESEEDNIMAMGAYQEPRGSWFPNVLY